MTELLSKLAVLAKRKPIFDDKPIEIGELTYVIKQDIFKIEKMEIDGGDAIGHKVFIAGNKYILVYAYG